MNADIYGGFAICARACTIIHLLNPTNAKAKKGEITGGGNIREFMVTKAKCGGKCSDIALALRYDSCSGRIAEADDIEFETRPGAWEGSLAMDVWEDFVAKLKAKKIQAGKEDSVCAHQDSLSPKEETKKDRTDMLAAAVQQYATGEQMKFA